MFPRVHPTDRVCAFYIVHGVKKTQWIRSAIVSLEGGMSKHCRRSTVGATEEHRVMQ